MTDETDNVFRALADPSRRRLLDRLHGRDGQTLLELQSGFEMTRFGVMKHLKILEEAGLVATRKVGREKFHYLNGVPIQQLYDRWVSKFARPWTRTLTGLKAALEDQEMATMVQAPTHVLEVYIRTTPERLWQALTDGTITSQYYFGTSVKSTWEPGGSFRYMTPDGGVMLDGEVIESDPPRRLKTTFRVMWVPEADRPEDSIVTWEIEPVGPACRLTLVHEGLDRDHPTTEGFGHGWAQILSGLKTLLETGEPLGLTMM